MPGRAPLRRWVPYFPRMSASLLLMEANSSRCASVSASFSQAAILCVEFVTILVPFWDGDSDSNDPKIFANEPTKYAGGRVDRSDGTPMAYDQSHGRIVVIQAGRLWKIRCLPFSETMVTLSLENCVIVPPARSHRSPELPR
jgi:hypothetical protein